MARYTLPCLILFATAAPAPSQKTQPPNSPFGHKLVAIKPHALAAHVIRRIGTARMHQSGGIASIAVSPDGKWMATGDRAMTNQVFLWDLQSGTPKWIFQGHVQWIARLEFSADSEYLLASHHDDTLHNFGPAEMV